MLTPDVGNPRQVDAVLAGLPMDLPSMSNLHNLNDELIVINPIRDAIISASDPILV